MGHLELTELSGGSVQQGQRPWGSQGWALPADTARPPTEEQGGRQAWPREGCQAGLVRRRRGPRVRVSKSKVAFARWGGVLREERQNRI